MTAGDGLRTKPSPLPEGEVSTGNSRALRGVSRRTVLAASIGIVAVGLSFSFDVPALFGATFQREQYLSIFLGLILFAAFLQYAPRSTRVPQTRIPFYDWVMAAVAGVGACYPAFNYDDFIMSLHTLPTQVVVVATLVVALILEATRRVAGSSLTILGLLFVTYSFVSDWLPGKLYSDPVRAERLFLYLYVDSNAILGLPLAIAMGIVLSFILFGSFLSRTGATSLYIDAAATITRNMTGGAGKAATVASAFFGTISGSAVANVMSTGVITIPMMLRGGFTRQQAAAIEAVASTGGQIMPPIMGATAFLMAELLNIPYQNVVVAALIPALLFYGSVLMHVHLLAARHGIRGIEGWKIEGFGAVLRDNGVYILPLVVLVYALFGMNWRPEKAAFAATAATIIVYVIKNRTFRLGYIDAISEAGLLTVQIGLITAVAGIIIGVLNISGLGFALTFILIDSVGGQLIVLLLAVMILCLVLGMGLPSSGIYLLLAVLVGPALAALKVPEIAGHLFIFYYGIISFITPPVCFAAFAAATLARSSPMRTGFESVRIALPCFVLPFLFIYHPGLLMIGKPMAIVVNVLAASAVMIFVTVAAVGFFSRPLSTGVRAVLASCAVLLTIYASPSSVADYVIVLASLAIGAGSLVIDSRLFNVREVPRE